MAAQIPPPPLFRRSVTLPTRFQEAATKGSPDNGSKTPEPETLFECSNVRIVSFAASLSRPSSSAGGVKQEAAGTLPWSKPTERVAAAGALRLYRVPGSVSFLNSGDLLLSLLPRSQCWCVDGVSKFAMKISMYIYRIELPFESDRDKAAVEELKRVLAKVLQYERTPCPFKRGFEDDLPEETSSPIARKHVGSLQKAKRWEFNEFWIPEGADPADYRSIRQPTLSSSPVGSDEESRTSTATDDTATTHKTSISSVRDEELRPIKAVRPRPLEAYRSITAPPKYALTLKNPFQSAAGDLKSGSFEAVEEQIETEAPSEDVPITQMPSTASSDQSFHTTQSTLSTASSAASEETSQEHPELDITGIKEASTALPDLQSIVHSTEAPLHHPSKGRLATPPLTDTITEAPTQPVADTIPKPATPPVASAVAPLPPLAEPIPLPSPPPTTELAMDPTTPPSPPQSEFPSQPQTPPPTHRQLPPITPPKTPLTPPLPPRTPSPPSTIRPRHSQTLKAIPERRRPSTPTSYQLACTPSNSSPSSDLTSALVSKTCALLMGPPSGLVAVMMQIAARIANGFGPGGAGAYRYRPYSVGKAGNRGRAGWVPGEWIDSEVESVGERDSEDGWGGSGNSVLSEEGSETGEVESEDEVDDYGVPLGCETPARAKRKTWGSAAAAATGRSASGSGRRVSGTGRRKSRKDLEDVD